MTRQLRANNTARFARPFCRIVSAAFLMTLAAGCDSLRMAPSEQQKQNAWLHNRTASVAAEAARAEQGSPQLQALTRLSELQSRAFTSYCGLPKEYPQAARGHGGAGPPDGEAS